MARGSKSGKNLLNKNNISKILRTLSSQESFFFYRGYNDQLGVVASSLNDFGDKLQNIDFCSIDFHFQRRDFEKWIKDTVGDEELSRRISEISSTFKGEELRLKILDIIRSRLKEFKEKELSQSVSLRSRRKKVN